MEEESRKTITPKEAAAAMMQFTMRSVENGWQAVKPAFAAYVPDAVLTEAQEDELLREVYIAALALEIYCIPHAFDAETARKVGSGMDDIMGSANFAAHRLAEPVCSVYVPRFQLTEAPDEGDLAMALLEEAVSILYGRLQLPLKPERGEGSLLWLKLLQFVSGLIGKWPALQQRFIVGDY